MFSVNSCNNLSSALYSFATADADADADTGYMPRYFHIDMLVVKGLNLNNFHSQDKKVCDFKTRK